ncbi:hypothetical protein GGS21DRAFT_512206 [Xylaria nigripes]|nr:hypothetical protein GGS21DRAFT_512206 [Xylaria nigripes]
MPAGRRVIVDGIKVTVPDNRHCWVFNVFHACGCRTGKQVRVKKDHHAGDCHYANCDMSYKDHLLPKMCNPCSYYAIHGQEMPGQ